MTKEPAHTPRWLWSANDKARSSNRYIVRLFHFELRAGVGSSGIGPVQSDMKTGDLAGPDRRLGTNSRTRSTPAGYRTFLLNFARPDGDLPRICARKISALRGDTNGSSLRWDISRHGSDLQRRLAGAPPDFAPLLIGLLGCDGHYQEPAHTIRSRGAHRRAARPR